MTGRIVKGIAGFYYVHYGEKTYECKARGILRKNHEKPLVGDCVSFDVISEEKAEGTINEICERKNRLIRPEIANVDQIFLTFSVISPEPNYEMLNRYLIMVHDTGIPVHLVVNKSEISDEKPLEFIKEQYEPTIYPVHFISVMENRGIEELMKLMEGKVTALAGPSGVGKSSLMNCLLKEDLLETGELSRKIDRGKNTTRHSELFCISENTYVFDTPGFTSVELDYLPEEELIYYFDEFLPFIPSCKYLTSCRHIHEKTADCAVKRAVEAGRISEMRYASYVSIREHLSGIRRY